MITSSKKPNHPPINPNFLKGAWEYVIGVMESKGCIKITAETPEMRAESVRLLLESGMRRSQIAQLPGFCSSSVYEACLRIGYHDITIRRDKKKCKPTTITVDGRDVVFQTRIEAAAFLGISEKNLLRNIRNQGKPKGRPASS